MQFAWSYTRNIYFTRLHRSNLNDKKCFFVGQWFVSLSLQQFNATCYKRCVRLYTAWLWSGYEWEREKVRLTSDHPEYWHCLCIKYWCTLSVRAARATNLNERNEHKNILWIASTDKVSCLCQARCNKRHGIQYSHMTALLRHWIKVPHTSIHILWNISHFSYLCNSLDAYTQCTHATTIQSQSW